MGGESETGIRRPPQDGGIEVCVCVCVCVKTMHPSTKLSPWLHIERARIPALPTIST